MAQLYENTSQRCNKYIIILSRTQKIQLVRSVNSIELIYNNIKDENQIVTIYLIYQQNAHIQ